MWEAVCSLPVAGGGCPQVVLGAGGWARCLVCPLFPDFLVWVPLWTQGPACWSHLAASFKGSKAVWTLTLLSREPVQSEEDSSCWSLWAAVEPSPFSLGLTTRGEVSEAATGPAVTTDGSTAGLGRKTQVRAKPQAQSHGCRSASRSPESPADHQPSHSPTSMQLLLCPSCPFSPDDHLACQGFHGTVLAMLVAPKPTKVLAFPLACLNPLWKALGTISWRPRLTHLTKCLKTYLGIYQWEWVSLSTHSPRYWVPEPSSNGKGGPIPRSQSSTPSSRTSPRVKNLPRVFAIVMSIKEIKPQSQRRSVVT